MKIYKAGYWTICNNAKAGDLLLNIRNSWFKYTNNELVGIPNCTDMIYFVDDVYKTRCKCTFLCRIFIKPQLKITKWYRIKHKKLFIAIEGLNAL